MSKHLSVHQTKQGFTKDDFLARFRKNLINELLLVIQIAGTIVRLCMILFIGIMVFLSGFNFVRILFALIAPVLFIFIVGSYFTLLPAYLVAGITLVSIASLASSEKGDSLVDWFAEIISSLSIGLSASTPSSISQKLMGFVGLSAIASLFLVFLV